MSEHMYAADPDTTAARAVALQDYMVANVRDHAQGLICRSADMMCRPSAAKRPGTDFIPAQGSMVGPNYDLTVGGAPLRVLVIAMESGSKGRPLASVEERTSDVLRAADLSFTKRNPHMRGVTMALQLVFGLPVDGSPESEHIQFGAQQQAHVLTAYAMANLLLCSAVKAGTMSSRSTGLMRASCARHMRATVDVLQPTLVISQGAGLDETLRASLGVTEPFSPAVARCQLDGNEFIWASLHHPTHHWDRASRPYLTNVVVPTLTQARALALTTP